MYETFRAKRQNQVVDKVGKTIKDIQKETGLGLATISKYINGGNVLDKNKKLIDDAIKKLDYSVNEFGRSLKTKKSMTVGIIIPELSNIFVTSIITVIEDILRKNGYSIIVCDCRTDEKLERDVIEFLLSKRVDGIISMPVAITGEYLKKATNRGIPIVLIDRLVEGIDADAVMVDNRSASEKAIDYLVENGHKNIGIIVGPSDVYTSQQRLIGYKNALSKIGIKANDENIIQANYTVEGGYEGMKKLISENKDMSATFVTNYEMTLGAIIAINEMNIKIPEDLSFIGFDNLQLSKIVKPKLSIVDQPLEQIGWNAANIILKRLNTNKDSGKLEAKQKIELMTSLIKRESVRKI